MSIGYFALVQSQSNGVHLNFNFGTRVLGSVSDSSTLGAGLHLDGGIGFELNPCYDIRLDGGIDTYTSKNFLGNIDRSYGIRATLQGVVNLSELGGFSTQTYRLKFHGGVGFYALSNPSFKQTFQANTGSFDDPLIKGNDEMIHFIFGLSPQYCVSERCYINTDLSLLILAEQNHYVDRAFNDSPAKSLGSIVNASLGITYYFKGK